MIVTDVGGLKETIGDRGTGIVAPECTPESIYREIERYFLDPSVAEECIRNIQLEKERLSWKGFAERLIEYIEKL
jgi:glycosyltransferase involved in cell wall biosynthesis